MEKSRQGLAEEAWLMEKSIQGIAEEVRHIVEAAADMQIYVLLLVYWQASFSWYFGMTNG